MSSIKKIVIIFSGIFLASIIGMAITLGIIVGSVGSLSNISELFQGHGFEVNESSSIDLAGINAVRIETASSDVHIIPSDVAKVELKGTVIPGRQKDSYLKVSEEDGTLLINVENDWFFFSIFRDFDLNVYLPADCMLDAEIHCASGNIDMTGMKFGNVELWRSSGNTEVRDCSAGSFMSDASSGDTKITSSVMGNTKLTCRSGNTTVSGTTGSIYAHATSGDIHISDASGALDVGCTSGNVTLDVAPGTVPSITAGLTSGNISIYMPSNAAFNFEARVTSGNISSELNIQVSGSLNHSFVGEDVSGTCNGGGPLLSVSVTSGNIDIFAK